MKKFVVLAVFCISAAFCLFSCGGGESNTANNDEASLVPSSNIAVFVIDSTNLYWAENGSWDSSTNTYNNDGAIKKISLTDGTVATIATSVSKPESMIVDSNNIYWVEGDIWNSVNSSCSFNCWKQVGAIYNRWHNNHNCFWIKPSFWYGC